MTRRKLNAIIRELDKPPADEVQMAILSEPGLLVKAIKQLRELVNNPAVQPAIRKRATKMLEAHGLTDEALKNEDQE
jgi:hypothetical protein